MVTAFVTLCLGLTLTQTPSDTTVPPDVRFLGGRTVKFPLKAPLPPGVRELRLFQSTGPDFGKNWTQVNVVVTKDGGQDCFIVTVETDGQYWFQVAAVDQQGKQDPEDLYESAKRPGKVQKLIILTTKPFVQIKSAQRRGEDIVVAWEIAEGVHLDWSTFKLEYQIQPSEQWNSVPATAGLTGEAKFQPGSNSAVKVRLSLSNRAKREGADVAEVAGLGSQGAQAPAGSLNQTGGTTLPSPPPDILGPSENKLPLPPPESFGPAANFNGTSLPPVDRTPPLPKPLTHNASWSQESPPVDARKMIGDSRDTEPVRTPAIESPAAPPAPSRKPLPRIEYVNTKEITLEYELTKVGPSGVGSVEMWFTRNDGQSWERYADDPEAKGPGRHKRLLPLRFGDGVVGFILVVRSGAGRGRREPRPGDVPDKRIEIDTKPPEVKFFAPVPDPQRANALLLSWIATDKNLGERPITWQWAEHREGPWFNIAKDIPNNGRHSWQLPESLPVQVFLRVCAVDLAGNVGVAVTREQQIVDLSEPEANLLGISAAPH